MSDSKTELHEHMKKLTMFNPDSWVTYLCMASGASELQQRQR